MTKPLTRDECRRIFALLSDYLDGDLPPGLCESIDRHVADCPPCVDFIESLRKSAALCREFRPGGPPPLTDEARGELRSAWRKAIAER